MKTYARGASGVIIVCDVTDRKTMEGAREWKQLADETLVKRPPTILVANKVSNDSVVVFNFTFLLTVRSTRACSRVHYQ